MNVNKFQISVCAMLNLMKKYRMNKNKIELNTLALVGEVGEIANKLKKYNFYDHVTYEDIKDSLVEELGDSFFCLVTLSKELNVSLSELFIISLQKAINKTLSMKTDKKDGAKFCWNIEIRTCKTECIENTVAIATSHLQVASKLASLSGCTLSYARGIVNDRPSRGVGKIEAYSFHIGDINFVVSEVWLKEKELRVLLDAIKNLS